MSYRLTNVMKYFSLLILVFYSQFLSGQDVTGTWVGTSTFMNAHTQLRYELSQEASTVTGFVYTSNAKDSLKATVKGTIKKGVLRLEPNQVIYKTGVSCVAKNELFYKLSNGTETLTGKWKGDMRLTTCPPLVAGNVTLIKQKSVLITVESDDITKTSTIDSKDAIGKALINELKRRTYHALIIGIDDYEADEVQDLDNPIDDATQLAQVLMDHYSFNGSNVVLLSNPTREKIIESLDALAEVVTEKDNVLIFYAGHGVWNEQLKQGYWLPSDASMRSKSYWISNSTLRDYIGGIRSKHTLLISDACFSGGILKERAVFGNSRAILEMYKLPSRKAMTSGTLKTVPDESVFIQYLLKNLLNNESPLLSADQLFRTFKTAVINNSPNGQVPQYGPIAQAGDEGGDFIFLRQD